MLQSFVITLREGLEACLIVAIRLAYRRQTGRRALIPAIHWGIAASILLSIVVFVWGLPSGTGCGTVVVFGPADGTVAVGLPK